MMILIVIGKNGGCVQFLPLTGLMWVKCADGLSDSGCAMGSESPYTWQAALDRASTSELARHANWRLPNFDELRSIVEGQCSNPAINLLVFPNAPNSIFWSTSPDANDSDNAWIVEFWVGDSNTENRQNPNNVRLVRDAQ